MMHPSYARRENVSSGGGIMPEDVKLLQVRLLAIDETDEHPGPETALMLMME